MFVARITRLRAARFGAPGAPSSDRSTASCASESMEPYSCNTSTPCRAATDSVSRAARAISPAPGKKHNALPREVGSTSSSASAIVWPGP